LRLPAPYRSLLIANMLIGLGTLGVAQVPERIAHVAQHYSTKDGFSGTVTFATAGTVIFRHGYGFADRARKSEFNEHTRFNIGSISKQFTAAAILLLQEDGRLKTSDRVMQLLPEDKLPQAWSEITIRELLSHTSGLKDYSSVASQEIQRDHTPADLLASVKDAPLTFKPGEGYEYSNTNYLLLGQIVQKVAAMPFCQFLHRRIFDPLGMQDTQCLEETGALEHHAFGYAPAESEDGKLSSEDPPTAAMASSFFFGAGNLVSTGDDLVRWTMALHHGRVLLDASYREMTTPVRDGYGYGLRVGSNRGHMSLYHDGSVPGFYSELEYFPGTDNTVVILSNQNSFPDGQFTPGTHVIDSELMTIAADPRASIPSEGKEVLTSPRVLQLFTGRYVSDDGKQPPFTISLHGKHLQLLQDGPGHSPSELRGDYGELDFYFSHEEVDLEFSGQNEAVIFDLRHSRALPFHRVQIGAAASEDK
jgi:CubicO group peptidase (beta-lactamase class C family)